MKLFSQSSTTLILILLILFILSGCSQQPAPVNSENIYRNTDLGLVVVKPQEWLFVSRQQSMKNRKNTDLQDKQLEDEIRRRKLLPGIC